MEATQEWEPQGGEAQLATRRCEPNTSASSSPSPSIGPEDQAQSSKLFPCPVCPVSVDSKRGYQDHVTAHIRDTHRPWADCEARRAWMTQYKVAICPECHKLAGANPRGKSKGIHPGCRETMELRELKAKEAEKKGQEEKGKVEPPTATSILAGTKRLQSSLTLSEASEFAARVPIPKSNLLPDKCVPALARVLHSAFDPIIESPQDSTAWVGLSLLATVLTRDSNAEKKRTESILERADAFVEGDLDALCDLARPIVEDFESKREEREVRERDEEGKRKDAVSKIEEGDVDKVLRERLSSGLADLKSQANIDELKSKFPQGSEVKYDPATLVPPVPFTAADVMKALKKVNSKKRAADSAGITPEVYHRILLYDDALVDKFTTVLNIIAASNTPADLNENLLVRGVALAKLPKGIRPLGIPSLLTSLVAHMFAKRHKTKMREAVEPVQQALSPGGSAVLVHAIRAYIAEHGSDPDLVLLLLDFLNAFNELDRQNFLDALVREVPEVGPFLYKEYASKKRYVYPQSVTVESTKGLIQGDTLGPAECCFAEKEFLAKLKELIGSKDFLAALMDDISLIVPQKLAIDIVNWILANGKRFGLPELNLQKTKAIFICTIEGKVDPAPTRNDWPKGIEVIGKKKGEEVGLEVGGKEHGVRSLGSFIGTPAFVTEKILERVETRAAPLLEFAVSLKHSGAALEVIKRVLAITGMDYVLQTTPPELTREACDHLDRLLRSAFERGVVGAVMSDEEWRRAQLPFPHGWNLIPTHIKALAAYTSSLKSHRAQILALSPTADQEIDKSLASLLQKIKDVLPEGTSFQLRQKPKQGELTRILLKKQYAEFRDHPEERIKVLFNGMSDRKAQAYKSAPPRPGRLLASAEAQIVVRRSLGMNICNHSGILECQSCGAEMDPKGDHECAKDGAWVKAHNAIRDVYYETAREGLVECKREQYVVFKPECADCHKILTHEEKANGHVCPKRATRKGKDAEKPLKDDNSINTPTYTADIVFEYGIPGLTNRRTLADLTIKHEFLPTYRYDESRKLGSAATLGEKEKNSDYKARTEAIDNHFVAVAFNSLGHARPNAEILAYYLIDQRAKHKGMTFAESASLFWHTLSFTIHRAHARNILTRLRDITLSKTLPRP
jgi:Reverse transcriptase (RNA-dependent DNA polymerase)